MKHAWRQHKALTIGVVVLTAILVFGYGVFKKDAITTFVRPGTTIDVDFPMGYKLEAYKSKVKLADVEVGDVTGIRTSDHGTATTTIKLYSGVAEKLGTAPSAEVSATTLLGGIYYLQLIPGGAPGPFTGDVIPKERASTPVELGDALTVFSPEALKSVRADIRQADATLQQGGTAQLRRLTAEAPGALAPAATVLGSVRGTRPNSDLQGVVDGLRSTARAATRDQDRLGALFRDLNRATGALAAGSRPLAESVRSSPGTLRVTRAGLTSLDGTLDRLTEQAGDLRPSAQELSQVIKTADPVLERARPVIRDLRDVLNDARPLVRKLVPTAREGADVLGNLDGPVVDRLNGPIADLVLSKWKGSGVYEGGGSPNTFYQEVAYLGSVGALTWQTHNAKGVSTRLMAGAGAQSIGGGSPPDSLEQYLERLGAQQPPGPQADRPGPAKPGPFGNTGDIRVPRLGGGR